MTNKNKIECVYLDSSSKATKYWENNILRFGEQIKWVKVFKETYDSYEDGYFYEYYIEDIRHTESPNVVVHLATGKEIWIFNGFSCGYYGPSPESTYLCLQKLGVPEVQANKTYAYPLLYFYLMDDCWIELWAKN